MKISKFSSFFLLICLLTLGRSSVFAQDLTDFVPVYEDTGADNFILDGDGTVGAGEFIEITFGSIINEFLRWDVDNNYFYLSDSLVVDGNVNLQGTTLRLDSDEVGNPDQDLDIIANQGSEASGVLRYDDGNNRWEISNNGGPFAAISTVGGGSSDFEGVYTTDADKVLTTSNGNFTINAGTGAVAVNASTGGVSINSSINGAVNIATGSSTGAVTVGGTGTQTIAVGNGAGNKTVNVGSTNTTSTTNINSGSGGVNVNVSNNQPTRLNTGSSTGAVTIGGNSNTVAIDSSSWDVSAAGAATGLTGITSTGAINFTGASSFRGRSGSADPGTCTVGEEFYNTTSNTKKLCLLTNNWFPILTGVFGSQYFYAENDSISTMTSTTFQQKLRLTTPSIPAGTYRIGWSYQWNHDSTNNGFEGRVQIDDSTEIQYHQQEPQDSAGTFGSTGTDQKHTSSGFKNVVLSSGVHFVDVDFRTNAAGVESSIWNTRIEIWRVQ